MKHRLGRESGLYDTFIRTDSQWITKQPVPAPARNARTLNDFDAVFLSSRAKATGAISRRRTSSLL